MPAHKRIDKRIVTDGAPETSHPAGFHKNLTDLLELWASSPAPLVLEEKYDDARVRAASWDAEALRSVQDREMLAMRELCAAEADVKRALDGTDGWQREWRESEYNASAADDALFEPFSFEDWRDQLNEPAKPAGSGAYRIGISRPAVAVDLT